MFPAILGERSTVSRGCTELEDESLYKCDSHTAGHYVRDQNVKISDFKQDTNTKIQEYTSCNCHGDGCNEDGKTAGQASALEVISPKFSGLQG